jgi:hypothetical protein
MVFPDFRRYAEVSGKEGRAKFRYQFLPRIAIIAKLLGVKAAAKAALVARPVGQFMQDGCVIALPNAIPGS